MFTHSNNILLLQLCPSDKRLSHRSIYSLNASATSTVCVSVYVCVCTWQTAISNCSFCLCWRYRIQCKFDLNQSGILHLNSKRFINISSSLNKHQFRHFDECISSQTSSWIRIMPLGTEEKLLHQMNVNINRIRIWWNKMRHFTKSIEYIYYFTMFYYGFNFAWDIVFHWMGWGNRCLCHWKKRQGKITNAHAILMARPKTKITERRGK